jgi:hypothetical protein
MAGGQAKAVGQHSLMLQQVAHLGQAGAAGAARSHQVQVPSSLMLDAGSVDETTDPKCRQAPCSSRHAQPDMHRRPALAAHLQGGRLPGVQQRRAALAAALPRVQQHAHHLTVPLAEGDVKVQEGAAHLQGSAASVLSSSDTRTAV